MSSLSSLVVDLSVNSAAMRSGLDSAREQMKSFGESMKGIGESIHSVSELAAVEFGTEIVKSLAEFVAKGAEAADHMGKLAQAAGEPVEEFSRLSYAMGLSGLSSDEVGVAFSKLNKQISAAGAGAIEQSALFEALGVKVKDAGGKVRSADAVLADLADKFAGMKDGASKSALAMEIFGKSGAALVPFLNRGREGIKDLEAEADRLGITLSGEAVAAATEFNDNLLRLQAASTALSTHVAAELAPALTKLTDELLNSSGSATSMKEAVGILSAALKVVASVAVVVEAVFEHLGIQIAATIGTVVELAQGHLRGAAAAAQGAFGDMVKSGEAAGARLKAIWADPAKEVEKLSTAEKKNADDTEAAVRRKVKAANDYKEALKTLSKQLLEMQAKVASIGQGPMADMINRITSGDIAKEIAKLGPAAGAMSEAMLKTIDDTLNADRKLRDAAASFALSRSDAATDRGGAVQETNFSNIGQTVEAVFKQMTSGFGSFKDALDISIDATKAQAAAISAAAEAAKDHDIPLENESLTLADRFGVVATAAGKAMTAFEDSARSQVAANRDYQTAMHNIGLDAEKLAKDNASKLADGIDAMFGGSTVTKALVAQFTGLGDALDQFAQNTQRAAAAHADAARLTGIGDHIAAQAEEDAGRHFEDLATKSKTAADAIEAMSVKMDSIISSAVSGLASKMGEAGTVIEGAIEGFKSGGIIGAIIGAIVAIIDKFSGFAKIMDGINKYLDVIIGALNGGVSSILELVQTLADVGNSISPLVPILHLIGDALTLAALTMEGTIMGIESAWAWVQGLFMDKKGQAATMVNVNAMKAQMTDQWNSMQNILGNQTVGDMKRPPAPDGGVVDPGIKINDDFNKDVPPIDDLGKSAGAAAAALDKMTAQLTNVPEGFKVAERRFQAMASPKAPPDKNASAEDPNNMHRPPTLNLTVQGGVMLTIKQLTDAVSDSLSQNYFKKNGVKWP